MHRQPRLLFGTSAAMTRVLDQCARFARTRDPMVLVGERGTGKTALAEHIHELSRRAGEFVTGRWTQEDPIGVAGGVNLYQFNHNNPVMYTDPFGLCPWCIPVVVGGAAVANSPAGQRLAQQAAIGLGLAGAAVVATSDQVTEAGAELVERGMTKLEKAFVTVMTLFGLGQEQKVKPPQEQKPLPPPPPIEQTTGPGGSPKPKLPFKIESPQ